MRIIKMKSNELALQERKRNTREVGFEILRIFAMFLICCVHVMNYGGMLGNAPGGGGSY